MVRVQPQKFRDIPVDGAMEYQFHQFDNNSAHGEHKIPIQTGMKRIVTFVLYGFLVLLLLILLMVTGIKFSQLNKEITDVKLHLESISKGEKTLSSSDGTTLQVNLRKITPVRGTCRVGWVSFQRGCYLLSTTALVWSIAEEQCKKNGGHLLVVNTVEELDYISRIVELRYDYWIGLVEREHEGHWSWVDGTHFNKSQTYWDEGQPDNWDYRDNGEDCGQLHSTERRQRKMWNDADCNLPYHYICEYRA